MWSIRQNGDQWEVLAADGATLSTHATYPEALAVIASQLAAPATAAVAGDGLLPEGWVSPISAEREAIDVRDFTEVTWSWRDPGESLLPLMLQTETDMGHFGAQLAGFITTLADVDGTVSTAGRFYDSEQGRAARDVLLDGRRFGVSVDPGDVDVEERCLSVDEDGWCEEMEWAFVAYQIIGLTMTPFPGFPRAYITLATAETASDETAEPEEPADDEQAAVVHSHAAACCDTCAATAARAATGWARPPAPPAALAAGAGRLSNAPPAAWFVDPALDRLTPLTITDDGRVFGHLAPWGQCHTASGAECVTTPPSATGYAYFRLGTVRCDNGEDVATGRLTYGGGHAALELAFRGAVEHYDNAGAARADVAAGEDAHGVWIAGALRPGVTDGQVRELRASSWSGDWRPIGAGLELVAALAVNSPGFPIARVASGRTLALVAAGAAVMAALDADPTDARLARLEGQLAAVRAVQTGEARARLRAAGVGYRRPSDAARDRLKAIARTRLTEAGRR